MTRRDAARALTRSGAALGAAFLLAASGPARPPARAALHGALPAGWENLPGDQLATLLDRLPFATANGAERARHCAPACATFSVRVDPIDDAHLVDRNDAAALGAGVVVARLTPSGLGVDARYGMRSTARAYFLVVSNPGTPTWRLLEVGAVNGVTSAWVVNSGPFVGCNHPRRTAPAADFKSCSSAARDDDAAGPRTGARGHGPSASALDAAREPQQLDNPVWITCTDGCCTAGV